MRPDTLFYPYWYLRLIQVTKVSIIPQGMAGGYTLTPPIEDRSYRSKKEFFRGNYHTLRRKGL